MQGGMGTILASARRIRLLTQAELARRLSVTAANISRIEHGADMRVSTLFDLARALQFEPVLIPQEHLPAVNALLRSFRNEKTLDAEPPRFG
jgi:HTH-type transcriptional regulator / antitoxin HipB